MSDSEKKTVMDEMSPVSKELVEGLSPNLTIPTEEYKVSHNRPPVLLIVLYILVIIWCGISWIPFYGY